MIDALYKPLANGSDDGIIRELLLDFYRTSKQRKPQQIIVFRNGVSESQLNQVLNIELEQIIKAYQHLGEADIPNFTVIVAQKNHHTKLFQASYPENGTSQPAHYHILFDEIGFSPDDLQNLIHSLSYVWQRSITAISIVAPICYAHLPAAQMGQFILFEDSSDTSITSAGSIPVPELPRLHKNVESSMFFC